MQGWVNIDGDWPMRSTDPEIIKMWKTLMMIIMKWTNFITDFSDEEVKCWKDYHRGLCEKALEVSKTGKNAIISFICYKQCVRDFCRTVIPDMEFIHIDVDIPILLPRFEARMAKAFPEGVSFKEMWASNDQGMVICRQRYGDEYTVDRLL